MDFYRQGCEAAFEKLGQGGLLKQLGGAWKGLTPGAQQALTRTGIGAGIGGVGGAVADTPGGALGGALLGAGAGYGAHRGLDFLKHRGHITGAKQTGLFSGAGNPLAKAQAASAEREALKGQQMNLFG